jgi:hypothetical protein
LIKDWGDFSVPGAKFGPESSLKSTPGVRAEISRDMPQLMLSNIQKSLTSFILPIDIINAQKIGAKPANEGH